MAKRRKKRRKNKKKRNLLSLSKVIVGSITFFVVAFVLSIIFLGNESINYYEEPTGVSEDFQETFIKKMAEEAIKLEEEYGIRPSITIAQSILESNWGQSGLAQNENNYFGIKGSSENPEYATLEYEENWTQIQASFRSYDSWEDSMEDYAKLLSNGTGWKADLYHPVLEASTYEKAAHALSEAGYATDPDYPGKLIDVIETYGLDQYDENSEENQVE